MDTDVQIYLTTKDARYSVPDHPISVATNSQSSNLNEIVKDLLKADNKDISVTKVDFDFLIKGEFLTSSLGVHLSEEGISAESIDIEYIVRQAPPTPEEEFRQDDLISCVKRSGKYILTGCYDDTIQLWTVAGDEPITVTQAGDKVKCVEWVSLDTKLERGLFLSGGFDQTVQLWSWDLQSNAVTRLCYCRGHSEVVLTCAVSPDQNTFVSGSWDTTIKLWSSVAEESNMSEETGGIPHLKKDAEKVSTRIPRITMGGHREAVSRVVWLHSNKSGVPSNSNQNLLASCSWDHTVRLWDVSEGREIRCMLAGHAFHDLDVNCVSSHPMLITAASDNRIRIYDTRAQEALVKSGFRGHSGWVSSVAWAPHREDQFVSGSIDGSVKLWDVRNPRSSLYDLLGHADMVTDVDWSQQDYILSSGADASVKIYRYR